MLTNLKQENKPIRVLLQGADLKRSAKSNSLFFDGALYICETCIKARNFRSFIKVEKDALKLEEIEFNK